MKKLVLVVLRVFDVLMLPFVVLAGIFMWLLRRAGIQRLPLTRKTLVGIGVFPVRYHYFEPQFDYRSLKRPLSRDRTLPAIDWNEAEQLCLLDELNYAEELSDVPWEKPNELGYFWNNLSFGPGDAEIWYQMIRLKKPRRIYEIGSGYSTLMTIRALERNKLEVADYSCHHVCIEPFEKPWLEQTGVDLVRSKVEDLEVSFFQDLEENDILFIDSSHMIRPEGDVLYEYFELLPSLRAGVIVHIHDFFSPRNYLSRWLVDEVKFWNEQYLVEAFLSYNREWKIIASLNYLQHRYYERLKTLAPILTEDEQTSSLYIQRVS